MELNALKTIAAAILPVLFVALAARVGMAALQPMLAPVALAGLAIALGLVFAPGVRRALARRSFAPAPYASRRRRRRRCRERYRGLPPHNDRPPGGGDDGWAGADGCGWDRAADGADGDPGPGCAAVPREGERRTPRGRR